MGRKMKKKEKMALIKKISQIEFGVFSPEEIRKMSVVSVEHTELYENGRPKVGGLADIRLGSIDRTMNCQTCKENMSNCPGHFGHIELNTPVYHVGFIKTVKKILECICYKCYKFRLEPGKDQYEKLKKVKEKFDYAWDMCKTKHSCYNCETRHVPLRHKGITLYYDYKKIDPKKNVVPLYPEEARGILSKVSDETYIIMGLDPINARPEWMILTVLPVPPPCVRPSVQMDINGKGEDDLTHMLMNIVRHNNLVKKCNSTSWSDYRDLLQLCVTNYFDNDVSGVKPSLQKGGRPIKSLSERLKGKEGRIRGNIMGKRVDFCARTVITGDPNISIEEIGVPKKIARLLTFPVKVTKLNIIEMQKYVDNGREYPGARTLFSSQEGSTEMKRYNLELPNGKIIKRRIKIGDIVERHIIDGDVILFNRQPTLHKMSMMAHRVRVLPFSTFRMNVNVCQSYNADFDGDECNLHMPQSVEAVAELMTLSTVSDNLVSPQANKPVNALVQDALCGIRKITRRDIFITKEELFQLILWVDDSIMVKDIPSPTIIKPVLLWTGKQIITMILPKIDLVAYHSIHYNFIDKIKNDVTMSEIEKKQKIELIETTNPYDTKIIIQNGELLSGIICKRTAGSTTGGLVHIIFNDISPQAARDFIDRSSQVVNQWMLNHGFSVGIADTVVPKETTERIHNVVTEQYDKVTDILAKFNNGTLTRQGNLSLEDTKEIQVQNMLSRARDLSGKIANENLNIHNNIKQMVESGSKGSILNICQISAGLGQQIVNGKRIPCGFKNRSLPHYMMNDDSPASRGYVKSSLNKGLQPDELFFHAMGGREGLIDTAVKTAETGYIQRRLIKGLEDLSVKYDGTVRNNHGTIFQFLYGEDGFDGASIEQQTFDTMLINDSTLRTKYYNDIVPEEFEQLEKDRVYLRKHFESKEDKCLLPVNIKRLIERIRRMEFPNNTKLEARYIYDSIMNMREELRPVSILKRIEKKNPSELFGILLTSILNVRNCLDRYKFCKEQFDYILQEIKKRYYKGLVQPGESVGILAAQSIGEPATQVRIVKFKNSSYGNKYAPDDPQYLSF